MVREGLNMKRDLSSFWCAFALLFAQVSSADTVLITGANSGIGLEFVKEYAAAGWTVIATHRHDSTPESLAPVIAQYKNVRAERMDVTSAESVKALSEKLKDTPIDVLINNAAVYADRGKWDTQEFGKLDYALGDTILTTNILGPLQVSEAFTRQVAASRQKKIVSITSTHGSLTEPIAGTGAIFYRASKAGLNRSMQVVADALKPQGITVVLIHPGSVRMTDQEPASSVYKNQVTVQESVRRMIGTINGLTVRDAGRFMLFDGTTQPW